MKKSTHAILAGLVFTLVHSFTPNSFAMNKCQELINSNQASYSSIQSAIRWDMRIDQIAISRLIENAQFKMLSLDIKIRSQLIETNPKFRELVYSRVKQLQVSDAVMTDSGVKNIKGSASLKDWRQIFEVLYQAESASRFQLLISASTTKISTPVLLDTALNFHLNSPLSTQKDFSVYVQLKALLKVEEKLNFVNRLQELGAKKLSSDQLFQQSNIDEVYWGVQLSKDALVSLTQDPMVYQIQMTSSYGETNQGLK